MRLVLDIGNTAVKGGFGLDGNVVDPFRMVSDKSASIAAYRHSLHHYVADKPVDQVAMVSVVPGLASKIVQAVRHETMIEPVCWVPLMGGPLKMGYKTPNTLGADRWAAAVGAWSRFGQDEDGTKRPVVVVDAGTAVNYEVIGSDGEYLGGAIAPGPDLVIKALTRGTAQLPDIRISLLRRVIGRSTKGALQSGIVSGLVDSVAGMLARYEKKLRTKPLVVATGGLGAFLAEEVDAIDVVEPHLVLLGLLDLLDWRDAGVGHTELK